jgi:hypothetical protein
MRHVKRHLTHFTFICSTDPPHFSLGRITDRNFQSRAAEFSGAGQREGADGGEWKITDYHNTDVKADVPAPYPQ